MPARTNRFQEIVGFFMRIKYPNAKISMSEMAVSECEELSDYDREIDFVVRTTEGEKTIRRAVEATGAASALHVKNFDSFLAKYWGPCRLENIDHVVLVTREGYSKHVRDKVAATNRKRATSITLLTLDGAIETDWAKVSNGTATRTGPMRIEHIRVDVPIAGETEVDPGRIRTVNTRTGILTGTLRHYLARALPVVLSSQRHVVRQLYANAHSSPTGEGRVLILANLEHVGFVSTKGIHALPRAWVTLHTQIDSGSAEIRECVLSAPDGNQDQLAYLEMNVGRNMLRIAIPKSDGPPPAIHLKLPDSLRSLAASCKCGSGKRECDCCRPSLDRSLLNTTWSARVNTSSHDPLRWNKHHKSS
ncbi:hypothetical protein [Planctomyces sp. SH-PL14]|uniref:hypothetical protein n=1 Tax=Planctomyces sp. SH-PL14 TaxID=1632864 RepID=UPI00078E2883|nr:hypothetical protein [Planctomyces sp. SH-PL14]AMV19253.1 hypothetical protein VT03_15285 [Planctomyces sp. SH-PL14]